MSLNLQQLAKALNLEFRGDAGLEVNGVASPTSALAGELCFVQERKYLGDINASNCSAVILSAELAGDVSGKSLLLSDNPQYSFVEAVRALDIEAQAQDSDDIHPTAVIADTASLGKGVTVGALVVIEDGVEVGPGTSIGAGSIIERSAKIGAQCHLHSRVTLGSTVVLAPISTSSSITTLPSCGIFSHRCSCITSPKPSDPITTPLWSMQRSPSLTVDRGALDDTIIERGCKLDNQIQVAHNVRIGAHTAIAACVGIAGSANIGCHCKISGAAVVLGHLTVTDNVTITAMSLVTKDIKEPGVYSSGTPLLENSLWHRCNARYKSLDKLAQTVARLEKSEK